MIWKSHMSTSTSGWLAPPQLMRAARTMGTLVQIVVLLVPFLLLLLAVMTELVVYELKSHVPFRR